MSMRAKRRRAAPRLAATVAITVVGALAGACTGVGHHPKPREGSTGARVMPASTWGDDARLVRAYEAAREMPAVFDGLYCYCECKEHFGHRSLLTCYESEHAASCDICLTEGRMATEMHQRGATLQQLRDAVDAQFRS